MMKTTFLFIVIFITYSLAAQEIKKEFHGNGQLKSIRSYSKDYKTWEEKQYYASGKLKSESNFKEVNSDKDIKNCKFYYENGQLEAEGGYVFIKENVNSCLTSGTWKCYKENGEPDLLANSTLNCPKLTKQGFKNVCEGVYTRKKFENSPYPTFIGAGWEYTSDLYEICCADPQTDTKEQASERIRIMMKYFGPYFTCPGYVTSFASGLNFFKFAIDMSLSNVIVLGYKIWNIDFNFIDPQDGKTLLDFIKERNEYFKKSPPLDVVKINEYQRIYDGLRARGAKHAHEL